MNNIENPLLVPAGDSAEYVTRVLERVITRKEQPPSDRCYRGQIEVAGIDITTIKTRGSDVPLNILDPNMTNVGITGSDILFEQNNAQLQSWTIPGSAMDSKQYLGLTPPGIQELTESSPRAKMMLYWLGIAEAFGNEQKVESFPSYTVLQQFATRLDEELLRQALVGKMIITSFPRAALQMLAELGLDEDQFQLEQRAGKIEGYWMLNPDIAGVIDISSTGATAEANSVIPVKWSDAATLELCINAEQATDQDWLVFNTLQQAFCNLERTS